MLLSLRLQNALKSVKSNHIAHSNVLKPRSNILNGGISLTAKKNHIHPTQPARTRFAPSPTGVLHLGSLRTALYNYLLAKQTGGQFLVRLEDTDQTRLVPGAEANIYKSLRWAGLIADESAEAGGSFGPYKQSDRMKIYQEYVDILLAKGLAYKCYCPKDRLVKLRESAQKLVPPTTVTYDRRCLHETNAEAADGEYIVRFKSPDVFPVTNDLQRGSLDIQPQYNYQDRRYDDFVIMKLSGLPTYHFANVVDDHLMQITHVIRGEEWLTSTPKHLALYEAFGWEPPKYVHVSLLTSLDEKKLSKRHGDNGVFSFRKMGITPEALLNFVALFGWSPKRNQHKRKVKEVLTLPEMVEKFRLDDMTRGNAKVSDSKLWYFNKHHLPSALRDPARLEDIAQLTFEDFSKQAQGQYTVEYYKKCLSAAAYHLDKPADLFEKHSYFFKQVDYGKADILNKVWMLPILEKIKQMFELTQQAPAVEVIKKEIPDESDARIMQSLRFALTGSVPGVDIASVMNILGNTTFGDRVEQATQHLKNAEGTKVLITCT